MGPLKSYSSDLTDEEWQIVEPLLPDDKAVGRLREVDLREVADAIFYRVENGVKWRNLPADFPAWQRVYGYVRLWVRLGVWEAINQALIKEVRRGVGRAETPSLGVRGHRQPIGQIGRKRGEEIGVEGFKKVKGRKRSVVVDILGLVLKCHVGAANQADVKAAPWVLFWVLKTYERFAKILADQGYQGDLEVDLEAVYGVVLEVVEHQGKGFSVQPKR